MTPDDVIKLIKEKEVGYCDLRFTDTPFNLKTDCGYFEVDGHPSKGYLNPANGEATTTANTLTFRVLREKDFSTVGWPASLI